MTHVQQSGNRPRETNGLSLTNGPAALPGLSDHAGMPRGPAPGGLGVVGLGTAALARAGADVRPQRRHAPRPAAATRPQRPRSRAVGASGAGSERRSDMNSKNTPSVGRRRQLRRRVGAMGQWDEVQV